RGLARAVGTEHGEDLAGIDLEVEPRDGVLVAVALAEVADLDRSCCRHALSVLLPRHGAPGPSGRDSCQSTGGHGTLDDASPAERPGPCGCTGCTGCVVRVRTPDAPRRAGPRSG